LQPKPPIPGLLQENDGRDDDDEVPHNRPPTTNHRSLDVTPHSHPSSMPTRSPSFSSSYSSLFLQLGGEEDREVDHAVTGHLFYDIYKAMALG
jgi:hypothetical protein